MNDRLNKSSTSSFPRKRESTRWSEMDSRFRGNDEVKPLQKIFFALCLFVCSTLQMACICNLNELELEDAQNSHKDLGIKDAPDASSLDFNVDAAKDANVQDTLPPDIPVTWPISGGSTGEDEITGVAVDNTGNIYIVGYFENTATLIHKTFSSKGSSDIFVAKLNSKGVPWWVLPIGGTKNDVGNDIAVDLDGNAYVVGDFSSNFIFANDTLSSKGYSDIFVAKISTDGTPVWARAGGGTSDDSGQSIAVQNINSNPPVFVTGSFESIGTFGTSLATSKKMHDIFVTKYSSTGTIQWLTHGGGGHDDYGMGITVDNSNNAYVTGRFSKEGDFTWAFGTQSLTATNFDDVFVAKLLSSGEVSWAFTFGSSAFLEQGEDIVYSDSTDQVYVTGGLIGAVTDATDGTGNNTFSILHPATSNNTFILEINAANGKVGDIHKTIGSGTTNDWGYSIDVDKSSIYVAGFLDGNFNFGSTTLTSYGWDDAFSVIVTISNQTVLTAQNLGGSGQDKAQAICVDKTPSQHIVYAGGFFQGNATYGTTTISSKGLKDFFLVKGP